MINKYIYTAKIVPESAMKACFQIAERRQSSAKIRRFFVTSKLLKKFLFQLLTENIYLIRFICQSYHSDEYHPS
ncbi:hypothetical protein DXD25_09075 [Prevotella sp. TF12-30]|nr:hypothetical protein DXD25_09075 [Prevotella sp. TF12-30]